jgi:hypothetical protein
VRERGSSLKGVWEGVLKTGNKRKKESRKEGNKERHFRMSFFFSKTLTKHF